MKRSFILLTLTMMCAAQSPNKGNIDRSTLDPTCKPCQDFYRYATGGWADKNPIPADRASSTRPITRFLSAGVEK